MSRTLRFVPTPTPTDENSTPDLPPFDEPNNPIPVALTDQLQLLAFLDPSALVAVQEFVHDQLVNHGHDAPMSWDGLLHH